MNKLLDVMFYFCKFYPHENELSNARLTKLIYLSDWFSSLVYLKQITNITWKFNHYGPYVDDIIKCAYESSLFDVIYQNNFYGSMKTLIHLNDIDYTPISLSAEDKKVIDFVIEKTNSMYFNEFVDYVYSTYPISSNSRYSTLNLPLLAEEYRHSLKK